MEPERALFATIAFWDDSRARGGPEQMACDEALLESAQTPVLRIFRWDGAWVSAGYFANTEDAKRMHPGRPFCRRWTGGGLVLHDGDFTYSLVVPSGEKLATIKAAESYNLIHSALARALREHGVETTASKKAARAGAECFAGAVQHDLLAGGAKIAGGAQRRTRRGLLHQGSVQCTTELGSDFGLTFARTLAESVGHWRSPAGFEARAEDLVGSKYAKKEFLQGPRARKSFTAAAMS
jgi:lipoate-protein ligase A